MKTVNVAIIGYKFMGKAHSNAWTNVTKFFDPPLKPVLKVACGRDRKGLRQFAHFDHQHRTFGVWPGPRQGCHPD